MFDIVDTGDDILDQELEDFIDVLLSKDRKLLKTTLNIYRLGSSPKMVGWIMDPPHFNMIQNLLIKNYDLKYISPRRTKMGSIDSHCGTALPASSVAVFDNWLDNVLKNL